MAEPNIAMRAVDKWKEAAEAGFQLLPDLLLKHQADLELSATDLVVLINITMHWWYLDRRPFPRNTTIAKRMGTSSRTVQRSLTVLRDKGLLRKTVERFADGTERQVCDLTGLQQQLANLARADPVYRKRVDEQQVRDRVF